MRTILFILIAMFVLTTQSFSFENFSIIHGCPILEVVENIEEVTPVFKTGHDVLIFDLDNFESLKLELLANTDIIEMTDFGLHRQNLFLYSHSTQLQRLKNHVFNRQIVTIGKTELFHFLC